MTKKVPFLKDDMKAKSRFRFKEDEFVFNIFEFVEYPGKGINERTCMHNS